MNLKADILKEQGIVISLCDYTGNFVRPGLRRVMNVIVWIYGILYAA